MRVQQPGQHSLLFGLFDSDKPHVGPGNRFADRLRIGGIRFTAFDIRLHKLRHHQFDDMSLRHELSGPKVSAATRFHANQTQRQIREEGRQLVTG